MIDKEKLTSVVEKAIEGTDLYIVKCTVSPDNNIVVELDSDTLVDIDQCVAVTRAVEAAFDRETEDYELEVGSVGLTSPLTLPRQFRKNIGKDVEVLTADGRRLRGVLAGVESDSPLRFTLETTAKVRPEGAKRPVLQTVAETLGADDCKYVRPEIKF